MITSDNAKQNTNENLSKAECWECGGHIIIINQTETVDTRFDNACQEVAKAKWTWLRNAKNMQIIKP